MSDIATPPRQRALQAGEFLTPQEVKDLAGGAAKLVDQQKVLERERIPHKLVGKRLIVSRYHAREWLAGRLVPASRGGVHLERVK